VVFFGLIEDYARLLTLFVELELRATVSLTVNWSEIVPRCVNGVKLPFSAIIWQEPQGRNPWESVDVSLLVVCGDHHTLRTGLVHSGDGQDLSACGKTHRCRQASLQFARYGGEARLYSALRHM
jgi:hypothetical protein